MKQSNEGELNKEGDLIFIPSYAMMWCVRLQKIYAEKFMVKLCASWREDLSTTKPKACRCFAVTFSNEIPKWDWYELQ